MNKRRFASAFIIILLSIIFGCDSNQIQEEFVEFENGEWIYQSPATFDLYPESGSSHTIYLMVRYTYNYSKQNLYIKHVLTDSTGNPVKEPQVRNIDLFDEKSGKPLGKSSLGDIIEQKVALYEDFIFPNEGKSILKVQQFMRQDTLDNVLAVGIRLEKAISE